MLPCERKEPPPSGHAFNRSWDNAKGPALATESLVFSGCTDRTNRRFVVLSSRSAVDVVAAPAVALFTGPPRGRGRCLARAVRMELAEPAMRSCSNSRQRGDLRFQMPAPGKQAVRQLEGRLGRQPPRRFLAASASIARTLSRQARYAAISTWRSHAFNSRAAASSYAISPIAAQPDASVAARMETARTEALGCMVEVSTRCRQNTQVPSGHSNFATSPGSHQLRSRIRLRCGDARSASGTAVRVPRLSTNART
jgi:hypothetical protein